MSTKHTPVLYLRPFDEVDRRIPDIGMRVLPGRVACLSHPIDAAPEGRVLLVAGDNHSVWVCETCGKALRREVKRCDKCGGTEITETRKSIGVSTDEHMSPDMAICVQSGVEWCKEGDVLLLKPDKGGFFPAPEGGWGGSGDSRELRLLGVNSAWYEAVLGRFTKDGFQPAPGWCLIEREPVTASIELAGEKWHRHGFCVSGEGQGETVAFTRYEECFTFYGGFTKAYALVRTQRSLAGFHAA